MSLYVLDTDTVTLLLRGHPEVADKAAACDPSELAVAIITVEEVLTGWYSQVRRAKKDEQLARAYAALQEAVEFFAQVRVLPFDLEAIKGFRALRRAHPRTGTNDLRIAAIVQLHKGTLVTRNRQDFEDIDDLQTEDWT
jgi:tRNA(fMet)-specific endonuclease VapC